MRRYAIILNRRQRNNITLRQLFNEWLPIHSQSISDSAVKSYHIAFKHISNISDMPITNIHFQHLQNVINSMHAKGLSYSSCKKVRTLLNQLFNYAIIKDYAITNYTLHLNLGPNVPTIQRKVFTRQQINKLWEVDTSYSHMILILLYTGLRIGELLNLRKKDIHRRSSYLVVRRAKTKAGEGRIIPIHYRIMPLIEQVYTSTRVYTHKTIRELRKAIELLK